MKDRQVTHASTQLRVPIISGVLHFISMTVLVFLRGGFGYVFLSPRTIFLASSWATILFSIVIFTEGMFRYYAGGCLFALGASALYILHLTFAFGSELRGDASHDNYSGTPHPLRILNTAGAHPPPELRKLWVMGVEPAMVLLAALAAKWPFGADYLSYWLLLVAPSLWLKEFLNHWLQLRQRKRQRDAMEDAEDGLDALTDEGDRSFSALSRKEKVVRRRAN